MSKVRWIDLGDVEWASECGRYRVFPLKAYGGSPYTYGFACPACGIVAFPSEGRRTRRRAQRCAQEHDERAHNA